MNAIQELKQFHMRSFFTYKQKDYVVYYDSKREQYDCKRLKWNLWNGNLQSVENVSADELKISNVLLSSIIQRSEMHRFCSEHYSISEKKGKHFIKKDRRYTLLKKTPSLNQIVFRSVLAIAMAMLYGLFYIHFLDFSVAANLFRGLSRNAIIIILFLIQTVGVLVPLVINRFKCDIYLLMIYSYVPLNLVSLFSVVRVNTGIRIVIVLVLIGSFVFGVIPKLFQRAKTRKQSIRADLLETAKYRLGLSILVCTFIGCFAIHFLGVSTFAYTSEKSIVSDDPQLISVYAESCTKLDKTEWKELDEQEKIEILQIISDYECKYILGCSSPRIVAGYTGNEHILGVYAEKNKQVTIDVEHLKNDSVDYVLDTLLHEIRHAYQYAVISMLNHVESNLTEEDLSLADIKKAFQFRDEFENYESGTQDILSYYFQSVEVDSRSWAEERMEMVYMDYFNLSEWPNHSFG